MTRTKRCPVYQKGWMIIALHSEPARLSPPLLRCLKMSAMYMYSPRHDGLEHAVQLGVLVGISGGELLLLLQLDVLERRRRVQNGVAVVSDGGGRGRIRRRTADVIKIKISCCTLKGSMHTYRDRPKNGP